METEPSDGGKQNQTIDNDPDHLNADQDQEKLINRSKKPENSPPVPEPHVIPESNNGEKEMDIGNRDEDSSSLPVPEPHVIPESNNGEKEMDIGNRDEDSSSHSVPEPQLIPDTNNGEKEMDIGNRDQGSSSLPDNDGQGEDVVNVNSVEFLNGPPNLQGGDEKGSKGEDLDEENKMQGFSDPTQEEKDETMELATEKNQSVDNNTPAASDETVLCTMDEDKETGSGATGAESVANVYGKKSAAPAVEEPDVVTISDDEDDAVGRSEDKSSGGETGSGSVISPSAVNPTSPMEDDDDDDLMILEERPAPGKVIPVLEMECQDEPIGNAQRAKLIVSHYARLFVCVLIYYIFFNLIFLNRVE